MIKVASANDHPLSAAEDLIMTILAGRAASKAPEKGMSYLYVNDVAWDNSKPYHLAATRVVPGTRAYDVKRVDGSYTFKLEGRPETFGTAYAWAFLTNDDANVRRWKLIQEMEVELKKLHGNLHTLASIAPLVEDLPPDLIREDLVPLLLDADPTCRHEYDRSRLRGIKCKHCSGWFCF